MRQVKDNMRGKNLGSLLQLAIRAGPIFMYFQLVVFYDTLSPAEKKSRFPPPLFRMQFERSSTPDGDFGLRNFF